MKSLIFPLFLISLLWGGDCFAALTRGPYLQQLGHDGVVVRFRTTNTTLGRVRYGTSPANLSSVVTGGSTSEHEISITGLTPQTTYYYQIEDAAGVLAGPSDAHTWLTHPVPGTVKPIRIWALGDPGTADNNQRSVRDAYLNWTDTHTDAVLLLGDIAYNDGTDQQMQAALFEMYGSFLRNTGVYITRGNHERNTSVYYDSLTMPTAGELGGLASGTEAYYSFDIGHVHFVCLDSYGTDRSPSSPMWTWLENDLASTTGEFIIAFFHHPPYTKGSHDSDREGDLIQMRQQALPIFDQYGVDLVLTGHSHSYERSHQIRGHYGHSSSFDPISMMVNGGSGNILEGGAYENGGADTGTVYIVAGSSGKLSGSIPSQANWHPIMHEMLREFGSMVIDVDGGRMDVGFLNRNGELKDTFTIIHPEIDYPLIEAAAPAPRFQSADLNANLVATGSFTTVEVFWASTDFGPDATAWPNTVNLGMLPEGLVTHTVNGLTEETQYAYRMRASNADGESWTELVSFQTATRAPKIASTIGGLVTNTTEIIPVDAVWNYYDQGSAPLGAWKSYGYNDASWGSGPGELGYGDGDEGTVIGFGPNPGSRYVTAYFRHTFDVPNPESISGATLEIVRDDGLALHFNETEVHRSNLAPGNLIDGQLANVNASGDGKPAYQIPLTEPLQAQNVFAAQLHQVSVASDDASFSLRLFTEQTEGDRGAVNLTYQSADVGFELLNEGQGPAMVTLYYGPVDGGTDAGAWAQSIALGAQTDGASFLTTIPNLTPESTYFYRYRVVNAFAEDWTFKGEFTTRSTLPEIEHAGAPDETERTTVVPEGSIWKYLDNGSNQGSAWRNPSFNDASWASGPAELGYGDGGEATVVSFGGNANFKHVTTYFRHSFTIGDAEDYSNLELEVLRDDGVAVYLNGGLVVRDNLPTTYGHLTFAPSTQEGNGFLSFPISNFLVDGENVLAVEIHQRSRTSSDISFDLALKADKVLASGAFNITPNSADLRANLVNEGQGPTTVRLYHGLTDGGTNPAAWQNVVSLGGQDEGLIGASLSNLPLESEVFYRFFATNAAGSDWAPQTDSFRVLDAIPEITANPASGVQFTTATANYTVNDDANLPNSSLLFYGTSDQGTDPDAWDNVVSLGSKSEGSYSRTLSGLQHDTTYVYRVLITNSFADDWSGPVSFTTQNGTPAIQASPVSAVDWDRATANASLTFSADAISSVQAYLGTADGGTNPAAWSEVVNLGQRNLGPLSRIWTGLQPSTTYVYRFRAVNAYGLSWSAPVTFTTAAGLPEIVHRVPDVSSISVSGAVVRGRVEEVGPPPANVILYYGKTDGGVNPAAWESQVDRGTQGFGNVNTTLAGLDDNTTYFFRYFISNASGSDWANASGSFSTLDGAPQVAVTGAVNVDMDSASANGSLLADNGSSTTITMFLGTSDGGRNPASWDNSVDLGVQNLGGFGYFWNNLEADTTYYYTFFAANALGSSWAPTSGSFTTDAGPPIVQHATPEVDDIRTASATVLGELVRGESPTNVNLLWGTTDGGGNPANWQNTLGLGVQPVGDLSVDLTGLNALTTYYFRYQAVDANGSSLAPLTGSFETLPAGALNISTPLPVPGASSVQAREAIPEKFVWKYLDDGSNQGVAWRQPTFDDRDWKMGWAKLGYGIGNETTFIGSGPDPQNKVVTTYFRGKFHVGDLDALEDGELTLFAGDGAVVYLNGVQLGLVNLPSAVNYNTYASVERPALPVTFPVSPLSLVAGVNHLAVEVHQASANGVDISFDAKLVLNEETPDLLTPGVPATNDTTATISYELIDNGGSPSSITIYFGAEDKGATSVGWDSGLSLGTKAVGTHTVTIGGLAEGTRYFYRFRAANNSTIEWTDGPTWFETTGGDGDLGSVSLPTTLPLLSAGKDASDAKIKFPSQDGRAYLLEYCPNLVGGEWSPVDLLFGNGGEINIVPFGQVEDNGYYRLTLPVR